MLRANETKQLRLNGISSALFNYEFTLHVNFPVTVDDLINFGNGVAALLAVALVYLLTGKIKYRKSVFFSITLFFFLMLFTIQFHLSLYGWKEVHSRLWLSLPLNLAQPTDITIEINFQSICFCCIDFNAWYVDYTLGTRGKTETFIFRFSV